MKNYIIGGVIVLLLFVSLAFASGTSIMTIKPAQPKSTIIAYLYGGDVVKFTYPYIRKGYIPEVSAPNSNGSVMVILTKY